MLQIVQIGRLYLQVFRHLIGLVLDFGKVFLCFGDFFVNALLTPIKFLLALFFLSNKCISGVVSLINHLLDVFKEFFASGNHVFEELQLVTVCQFKVALDAHWVDFGIAFRKSALNCAWSAD